MCGGDPAGVTVRLELVHIPALPPAGCPLPGLFLDTMFLDPKVTVQTVAGGLTLASCTVTVPVGFPPFAPVTIAVNVNCIPYVVGLGGCTVMVVVVVAMLTG